MSKATKKAITFRWLKSVCCDNNIEYGYADECNSMENKNKTTYSCGKCTMKNCPIWRRMEDVK